MELEVLLRYVRQRLERSVDDAWAIADRLPPWQPPEQVPPLSAATLLERFVDRARESGASVEVLGGRADLEQAVLTLLARHSWRSILCAKNVWSNTFTELRSTEAAAAEFGLCEAAAAAAETGSVLLVHDAGNPRGVSLLPPAVGVVVRASSIVPRLTGLLEFLGARGDALESCVTLVCGPSRSADIGSITCFGAHGPAMVCIWVILNE